VEDSSHVLAQVNIGRLVAPLDSPQLADFVAWLEPVNAVADSAPGFVWRLQTEDGDATALRAFSGDAEGADGGILINMSVWESVEALAAYVYGDAHRAVLRRRREWFERLTDLYAVAWWIPRGHIPTIVEAEGRLRHLRRHGPAPHAFTLRVHYPPPDSAPDAMAEPPGAPRGVRGVVPPEDNSAGAGPLLSPDDWACTV
jgi:Domain of unknown function (DUF3291)